MSRAANFRIFLLPLSVALIAALVMWRLWREADGEVASARQTLTQTQLAPRFELYDQNNQLVKFERYLGRTRLVVVFFDAAEGADRDPHLTRLREHIREVESAGVQVIGVSTAVPAENRRAAERLGGEFPFPVLTDIDPIREAVGTVHQAWGMTDAETGTPQTGLFLIDRAGRVVVNGVVPAREADPRGVVDEMCRGVWPELAP